jgi:Spy/CpxP family protein refolding chaperone
LLTAGVVPRVAIVTAAAVASLTYIWMEEPNGNQNGFGKRWNNHSGLHSIAAERF